MVGYPVTRVTVHSPNRDYFTDLNNKCILRQLANEVIGEPFLHCRQYVISEDSSLVDDLR